MNHCDIKILENGAENVAFLLKSRLPEASELAFLITPEAVYFACHHPRGSREPTSAIVKLIQGIYQNRSRMARKLMRHRIYSTCKSTEMCRGMLKVAAKRLTECIPPKAPDENDLVNPPLSLPFIDVGIYEELPLIPVRQFPSCQTDQEFMKLALDIARSTPRDTLNHPLHSQNRAVGALLVSPDNEILQWAPNTNASNRTLHAEVNLVQSFHRRTGRLIPKGSRIYVSLKSCKMCAAMIWRLCEAPASLKVYYGEDDPGPNARQTLFHPGSPERLRTCASEEERQAAFEFHLPCD